MGGLTAGGDWPGVVPRATCEADVDRRPTVRAGRSTRRAAHLDGLVGLTDDGATVVTASDCQRFPLLACV